MPNDNPSNLPAIAPKSPLAEGGTINMRPIGDQIQLRIWIAGTPVENSMHATAKDATGRLIRVVMGHFGGPTAVVGLLLGALANHDDN